MRFEFKLAARYLMSKRRSSARFTSAIAVLGIGAGVAALIVAQAIGAGVAAGFRDRLLEREPHVRVSRTDRTVVDDWETRRNNLLRIEGVVAVTPAASEHVLLTTPSRNAYALVRTGGSPEVLVGVRLAHELGLAAGDRIEIVAADSPKPLPLKIGGFLETGIRDFDSVIIELPPEHFAALGGRPNFIPQFLAVRVGDPDAAPAVAGRIMRALGDGFEAVDWQTANRPFFAAIELERRAASVVLSLIVLLAAFSISATLSVLINERRFDIAVLRTCGARARSIVIAFFLEGIALGLTGTAGGAVAGLGICAIANRYGLFSLDPLVYSVGQVELLPTSGSVLAVIAFAFAVSIAASVYPSFRAARVKPLENLRRA